MHINLVAWTFNKKMDGYSQMATTYYDYLKRINDIDITTITRDDFFRSPKDKTYHFLYIESIMYKFFPQMIITLADIYPADPAYTGKKEPSFDGVWYGLRFLGDAKHLVTLTDVGYNELINIAHVPPEKVTIIPAIMDPEYYIPRNRNKGEKTVIGIINHLDGINKVPKMIAFIRAFIRVNDPDIELHIYGRIDSSIANIIRYEPNIKYGGVLPDDRVVDTYKTFDVFLCTSTIEGFGYPLMKAKAMHIPILCYDGLLGKIAKDNTYIWDESNIGQLLRDRVWEHNTTQTVNNAYIDALKCTPDKVMPEYIKIYEQYL